jgi:hypothetical protein
MNISNLGLVPLRQASLCLDCEMITAAHTNCAACGSSALLNVARALSRPGYSGFPCRDKTAGTEISTKLACQRVFLQGTDPKIQRSSKDSPRQSVEWVPPYFAIGESCHEAEKPGVGFASCISGSSKEREGAPNRKSIADGFGAVWLRREQWKKSCR